MATVSAISWFETGEPSIEVVRATLSGATSTYVVRKFGRIQSVLVTVEGTNAMTYTWTTKTITITGTSSDEVNIMVTGCK